MTIIMIIVNLGWSEIRKQNQSVLVRVIWFAAPSLAGVFIIMAFQQIPTNHHYGHDHHYIQINIKR